MIAAGVYAYFEEYLAETERLLANNDQQGVYKHQKSTIGLEGKKARNEQVIRDENGTLLRRIIRERLVRSFDKLLRKSMKLGPSIIEIFHHGRLVFHAA